MGKAELSGVIVLESQVMSTAGIGVHGLLWACYSCRVVPGYGTHIGCTVGAVGRQGQGRKEEEGVG